MTQLVKNKTTGNMVDIEKAQMLGIRKGPIHTGSNGFTVICYHMPQVGYKLAEFSTEEDAKGCLDKVTEFKIGRNATCEDDWHYLEIDDKVTASLLELPTAGKGSGLIQ